MPGGEIIHASMTMQEHASSGEEPDVRETAATVFVVDDDAAVRRSLLRLLRACGWSVETFASADAFLERAPSAGCGCVLLDVDLPGTSGIEAHARLVDAGINLPVVFLTGKGDIPTSVYAIKHGAVDFLEKPVAEATLLEALGQAVRRQAVEAATRHTHDAARARLTRLSEREREVLERVLQGRLNKQIAYELGIAEKTVKAHRGRVMAKMEVATLAELVHLCHDIDLPPPRDAA